MAFQNSIELAQNLRKRVRRRIVLEQKKRSPFYRRFPCQSNLTAVEFRTLISWDKRCVYSRIPKAANSTVVATLFVEPERALERKHVEKVKFGDIRPSALNKAQVDDIAKNFFKFTVVRNPYARALSSYRDKIAHHGPITVVFREKLGLGENDEISFDGFLERLAEPGMLLRDAHWMPQLDLLAFPLSHYDFVGSVEDIGQDLQHLQDRLGISRAQRDYVPNKTGSTQALSELTPSQQRKIQELYAKDFEGLNYSDDIRNLHRS